ncbi:hypothetical protein Lalb_Chr16g0381441 [Lupinus albus]|uniref:Uncharacterized protein n=1 Tax=Lupinus albus TaxID=3870 RepID=A0A6A4P5M4_LUPAL|nr:hypothetical protein Lalb_Chr16g0381441 [Lupinus albus]
MEITCPKNGVPLCSKPVKKCHVINIKIKKIENYFFYITWCNMIGLGHEDIIFLEQVILVRIKC